MPARTATLAVVLRAQRDGPHLSVRDASSSADSSLRLQAIAPRALVVASVLIRGAVNTLEAHDTGRL